MWFDVHVWTDGPTPDSTLAGMFSYDTALGQIANGANYQVVVFELNANNHSQRRALANALAINAIERDGRLPITTSANCLQPDGQNDNGWDQGLLFLNPPSVVATAGLCDADVFDELSAAGNSEQCYRPQ